MGAPGWYAGRMEKLGEKTHAKPGSRLMPIGVACLVLSVLLLVMNLSSRGGPSGGFWILLLVGVLLAGVGFARRILSSR
jgi:hypothetical protein